ncbi:MFS transporter [Nocardia sp. CA-120079]|uniref:MFS transporter n=1 Tax=Nocardia sp. CA-120079 TaxID=3239974 RepID=UPI003D9681A5
MKGHDSGIRAIGVFLIGSVLAGASWSMPALIGFRALQGLGAGGIAVTAFAVIGALVPPRERGKYQGMTATTMAVGTIGGPLLSGVIMFGSVLYLPLFQQTVQGASAANSGLLLLPMMLPLLVVSQIVGKRMTATGKYKIFFILGGLFLTAGAVLLSTIDVETGRLTTGFAMALLGAGLGFAMQLSTAVAQNSVEMANIGAASGAVTLFRTLGFLIAWFIEEVPLRGKAPEPVAIEKPERAAA